MGQRISCDPQCSSCFAAFSHQCKPSGSNSRNSDAKGSSDAKGAFKNLSGISKPSFGPSSLMQRRHSKDAGTSQAEGEAAIDLQLSVKVKAFSDDLSRSDRSLSSLSSQLPTTDHLGQRQPRRHSMPNIGSGPLDPGQSELLYGAPARKTPPVHRSSLALNPSTLATLVSISQDPGSRMNQRRRSAPAALGPDPAMLQASLAQLRDPLPENAPIGINRDGDEKSQSSGALSDVETDDEEAPLEDRSLPPPAPDPEPQRLSSGGVMRKIPGADRNVIFFDWDDTLFPSTWIRGQDIDYSKPCPPDSPLQEPLRQHSAVVVALLETALQLSSVAIVTLSRTPWVTTSVYNFLPDVAQVLAKNNLGVFYAHEAAGPKMVWEPGAGWPSREGEHHYTKTEGQVYEFDTVLKRKGMRKALGEMGHTRENQDGLMQLMSVGDSMIEHSALQDLQYFWSTQNRTVPFNVKTIKLMGDPSIEELIAELSILKVSLERLVHVKEDFEIEFGVHNDAIKIMKSNGSRPMSPKSPQSPAQASRP